MLMLAGAVVAHGDIHERIAGVSARIEKEPGNAQLWLLRGELHREHRDFAAAAVDFREVEKLDAALNTVRLSWARLWLEAGEPAKALVALDRFQALPRPNRESWRLRTKVLRALGEMIEATQAAEKVLFGPGTPSVEDFLTAADLAAETKFFAGALASLERGLEILGPNVVLEVRAIEVLLLAGSYEDALVRTERALRRAGRSESWWELKARILSAAGRSAEAAVAARAGLAAIESLPAVRRDTAAVQELTLRLRGYLSP